MVKDDNLLRKKRDELRQSHENENIQRKLQYQQALMSESSDDESHQDPTFDDPLPSCSTYLDDLFINTRSTSQQSYDSQENEDIKFPKVKVRNSCKDINEKIIRCTIQCLADYKVSPDDIAGIIVNTANIIFDQQWEMEEKRNEYASDDSDDEEVVEPNTSGKRRKYAKDLTNVFPSRRTINRYLEDASYMNLLMVAEELLNKCGDDVVTVGLDDTTKAAGHKLYNVKADHITISGPDRSRKTMTTGYTENVSHSGADGAASYELKLRCLALLADSDVEDIKSSIDFWMTDRAGDCTTLLQHLGVTEEKILKCSAHIILGADHAADKVFKNTEQKSVFRNY